MDNETVKRIVSLETRLARLETLEQPGKAYGTWANRPASPFSGQTYFATDRGIIYRWNGVRWTTTQLFTSTLTGVLPPVTASLYDKSSATISGVATDYNSQIVPRYFDMGFYIPSGNFDASNYWQVRLYIGFVGVTGTQIVLQSLWQTGRTTGTIYTCSLSIGSAAYTNAYTIFRLSFIAVGSPGPLEFNGPTVTYELGG